MLRHQYAVRQHHYRQSHTVFVVDSNLVQAAEYDVLIYYRGDLGGRTRFHPTAIASEEEIALELPHRHWLVCACPYNNLRAMGR